MPSFEIVKTSYADAGKSFRVSSIIGTFDLQSGDVIERFKGNIDIEGKDWNIGVIFGASGSGKTTIAKEIFGGDYFVRPKYRASSVVDDMPKHSSVEDITRTFTSVGFGSVPSWLKPYAVLSNGEKMRVDIAYALLRKKQLAVFDEFTSVVDRQVAQIGSFCIQKATRKANRQFIAVSCHDDIIDWLEPDWIFDANVMEFRMVKKKGQKLKLRSTNHTKKHGKCLRSIII